jgi:DNA-directed RNA polymerase subunit RPC12/RpoP
MEEEGFFGGESVTYVCSVCGRQSRLPDYCHGQPMSVQSTYTCPNCGATSSTPGVCCGQQMVRS